MDTPHRTIEFLFINRDDCHRCSGTEANLLAAIDQARAELGARGIETTLDAVHVTDVATAIARRLVSSPTVRVDGRDIGGALVESECEADGCTCSDGSPIDCRLWEWQGRRYDVPPVEMLVARIIDPAGPALADTPYELPQNLARYFASARCCAPELAVACCAPTDKVACCGDDGEGCGCR